MYATVTPITLYVDEKHGSDKNPGDLHRPLATIQTAVNRIPKRIQHPVVILVAEGNYSGAIVEGFTFDNAWTPDGAYLAISGTLVPAVLASGPNTGTVSDGTSGTHLSTNWGTASVAGADWTTGDLRGKLIEVSGGSNAGQIKAIADNSDDRITVAGDWVAPAAGQDFAIYEWGTIINAALNLPPTYIDDPQPNHTGFIIGGISASIRGGVFIERLAFTNRGNANLYNYNAAKLTVNQCKFSTSSRGLQSGSSGRTTIISCVGEVGPRGFFHIQLGTLDIYSSLDGNVVDGGATALYIANGSFTSQGNSFRGQSLRTIDISSPQPSHMYGDSLEGVRNGVAVRSSVFQPFNITITDSQISDFQTAIQADQPGTMVRLANSVVGRGNDIAINASRGATVSISPQTALSGTTELSIDGKSYTLAELRAANPRILSDGNFLTRIYES